MTGVQTCALPILDPISDTIEPSPLPELYGEDVIYVFLDTNGEVPYGFKANDSFYANQLIVIRGQHGLILSSELYDYSSTADMEVWHWTLNRAVDSAAAGNELEFMVSGLGSQFKAYFHLISWDYSEDYSDGFWVMTGDSRSRTSPTWSQHTIEGSFNGASSVYAVDIDGDGNLDVLATADTADDITWWENNLDGLTSPVWIEHTIDGSFEGARSAYAIDLDNDGDMDVLGAADQADDITWWENVGDDDGDGTIDWSEHTIDGDFLSAYSVHAADIDGDGDIDVLGASNGNSVDYDIT